MLLISPSRPSFPVALAKATSGNASPFKSPTAQPLALDVGSVVGARDVKSFPSFQKIEDVELGVFTAATRSRRPSPSRSAAAHRDTLSTGSRTTGSGPMPPPLL